MRHGSECATADPDICGRDRFGAPAAAPLPDLRSAQRPSPQLDRNPTRRATT